VTPLCCAAYQNHDVVVQSLIEAGADINRAFDGGRTPLFIAAQKGHKVVVRVLIEAGASLNKARDDGMTPLSVSKHPRLLR
jgi:ankyrin repeat protein